MKQTNEIWINTSCGSFQHGELTFEKPGQYGDVELNVDGEIKLVINQDDKAKFIEDLQQLIARYAL